VDYSKAGIVKNALFNYDGLMALAREGDQAALTVCIDIKRAIHTKGVLTFKQRRYLSLWWQGFNTIEIATMYNVTHVGVIKMINRSFIRISRYLCGKGYKTPSKPYCNYRKGATL